jgi:hypothetical protein
MENTLATCLMIAFLLIGAVGGVVLAPERVVEDIVEKEVQVPYNVTVEKIVEVPAVNQLDLAVAEFMKAVEDEEDEAGNSVDILGSYNFDEVEVSRVYDDYTVSYDGDMTTVDFSIKLRFDMEDKEAEKETFDVTVIFKDDVDTEVIVA